ncbi:MAG: phage holin family protein [Thermoanaerobaculia bacterium]
MTNARSSDLPPRDVPLTELLRRLAERGTELGEARIGMARAELAKDLEGRLRLLALFGVAALLVLCGLQLVVVALVIALAETPAGWLAVLAAAVPFLIAGAGLFLLARSRTGAPFLRRTLEALKEDLRWLRTLLP